MAYSSILGAEVAPQQPKGRDAELLGPSDRSDSGSDALYTDEPHADSDAEGTGERGAVAGMDAPEGADIMPDRVVNLSSAEVNLADLPELTDLDEGEAEEDPDD